MQPTPTLKPSTIDPTEIAELRRRRLINRTLLGLALALPVAALGFITFKAGSHALASYWMRANRYRVEWEIKPEDRLKGGATHVKSEANFSLLGGGNANHSLACLAWLHRVESLDLSMSYGLQDQDLAVLSRLTNLKSLSLSRYQQGDWSNNQPKLTDAALVSIHHLTRLQELSLGGNEFTDDVLANLASLDRLVNLDLRQTKLTDSGLTALKSLSALKSLDVTGTRVTAEGVAGFESARPGVIVLADHLPITPPKPTR